MFLCSLPQVYQNCVYRENSEFVSYKRVLAEMGPPLSDTLELASFHSASKGFMGEYVSTPEGSQLLVMKCHEVQKCNLRQIKTDLRLKVYS